MRMKVLFCGGVRKGHRGEGIKGEVVAEQDIIDGTKERFEGGGHPFPDLGPWWITVLPMRKGLHAKTGWKNGEDCGCQVGFVVLVGLPAGDAQ